MTNLAIETLNKQLFHKIPDHKQHEEVTTCNRICLAKELFTVSGNDVQGISGSEGQAAVGDDSRTDQHRACPWLS